MTSVMDSNVFNIAIEGTFDECQAIMKGLFADREFAAGHSLGAVNSVNWTRIMAQVVYYFYAALRVMEMTGSDRVRFAVPTGNFGDIFAGYMASMMGLPADCLVLATNENDILARFFATGIYRRGSVRKTISPSMDIQVASNFERYLYYRLGRDGEAIRSMMAGFAKTGEIVLGAGGAGGFDPLIVVGSGNTEETLRTISDTYRRTGYLLDPHTAVGVHVAKNHASASSPMIALGTAHPAKFPEAIMAATGRNIGQHPVIAGLTGAPTRCKVLPSDSREVRKYVEGVLRQAQ